MSLVKFTLSCFVFGTSGHEGGIAGVKAQYLVDGVLVRPQEPSATRFLSSRYYNGRSVVDCLESVEAATHWFAVQAAELGVGMPTRLEVRELQRLLDVRSSIGDLYAAVIESRFEDAEMIFNSLSSTVILGPHAVATEKGLQVGFDAGASPLLDYIAEVIVSAAMTLTLPRLNDLKKCDGPHCVLYYTQHRSGQQWCSNTCGNRARVARHANK